MLSGTKRRREILAANEVQAGSQEDQEDARHEQVRDSANDSDVARTLPGLLLTKSKEESFDKSSLFSSTAPTDLLVVGSSNDEYGERSPDSEPMVSGACSSQDSADNRDDERRSTGVA